MADRIVFDEAALKALFDSPDGPVGKYLAKGAVRVTRRAKELAPVDTGRLRSSIDNDLGRDDRGLVARIGSDVVYAPYVEFGTRRMRAQPFLRPALDAAFPAGGASDGG
jgi:HK97 gp10 family phage protein